VVTRTPSLQERVERYVFELAMSQSPYVQGLLAGRPVKVDGQTLAVDTQLMLRLQRLTREPGAETLPLPEARRALARQAVLAGGEQPVGAVRDLDVDGLPARVYTPTLGSSALLVFLHGGGFFLGDLDSHDAPCRFIAERAGVNVLSVDYRLAPEHPFPAAYDDALAAFRWAHEHADELGVDPQLIGVGGDSAGGNLSAGVAHAAARSGLPCAAAILIYPATDRSSSTRSSRLFNRDFYLTQEFLDRASSSYSATPDSPKDPHFSPGLDAVPPGLAPTYVFTAGFDPLRDEGEAYAERLADAGAEVVLRRFPDQIHGFLNVLHGRTSVAANVEIAATVGRALSGARDRSTQ
jgi:acetyl esterase